MYQRILVPIDGSPTSARGLDEAIRLARNGGGRIRLLHVLDPMAFLSGWETGATYVNELLPQCRKRGQSLLDAAAARATAAGISVETFLGETSATRTCDVVCDDARAWGADVIVIGTHGRRGVARAMLGSDAEGVARHADVPVLLVRAHDDAKAVPSAAAAESAAAAAARIATAMV